MRPVLRHEVWLANLDPTVGSEIRKTRPTVVVSPDEMNRSLRTVIIAPLTGTRRPWPTRVPLRFDGKDGDVALDQIRAVDTLRLVRRLGKLEPDVADRVLDVLGRLFAP